MKQKKIVLFGVGIKGKKMLSHFRQAHITVDFLCDNNPELWEKDIEGIKVISPQELLQMDSKYILITTKYIEEIRKQLLDMGIDENDFIMPEDIYAMKRLSFPSENYMKSECELPICNKTGIDISIVVLTKGDRLHTEQIKQLEETLSGYKYEIIIPSNGEQNIKGKHVVIISDFAYVQTGWLDSLFSIYKQYNEECIVGSQVLDNKGSIISAGQIYWQNGNIENYYFGEKYMSPESSYVRKTDGLVCEGILLKKEYAEKLLSCIANDSVMQFFNAIHEKGIPVIYQPESLVIMAKSCYQRYNYKCEDLTCLAENSPEIVNKECYKGRMLLVESSVPRHDKTAAGRTIDQYITIFQKIGMQITLLLNDYTYDDIYVKAYQQKGILVIYGKKWQEKHEELLKNYLKGINYAFFVWPHCSMHYMRIVKESNKSIVTSYYGGDIHYIRLRRQFELTHDPKLLDASAIVKKQEEEIIRNVDYSGYPSHLEVDILKKQFPDKNIQYYPAFYYQDREIIKKDNTCKGMIFVGAFGHAPNSDGVLWFAQHVMPILRDNGFTEPIYIVGSNPPQEILALADEQFIIKGYVTDDELTSLYKDCRMAFAPLRFGAGIKGKILEAMYNGLPMVTTHIGAESIDIEESGLIIADTPEEYAKAILDNYYNNDTLIRRSEMGQRYTMKYFGEEQLEKLFSAQIWGKEFSEK